MKTPWGISDFETVLAEGIIRYSTPGHGGIWLSEARWRLLESKLGRVPNAVGRMMWWEEDCDWAIPYLFFSEDLKKTDPDFEKAVFYARSTVENMRPELLPLIEACLPSS